MVVIIDWYKNNWIDTRRKVNTIYREEKSQLIIENNEYLLLAKQPLSNGLASIEENRIEENRIYTAPTMQEELVNGDLEEEPLTEEPLVENLFSYLEKAWGRTLSSYEYELLSNWEFNEVTKYAIKESVKCNARSIKYVERIIENLKNKGITTEADAIKDSDCFKTKRRAYSSIAKRTIESRPKWFDEETKQNQEPEKANELKQIIESFK